MVDFRAVAATAMPFSASPRIELTIEAASAETVRSLLLKCVVRIEAGRRLHDERERSRLEEVFGRADVWARSPKSLVWTNTTAVVGGFDRVTTFPLELPCSFDFSAAAARYLHGLESGEVPVVVFFSGTAFVEGPSGLTAVQIPRDREAAFGVPVALFRKAMDEHFAGAALVSVRGDVFERLNDYRRTQGLRNADDAIERLLVIAARGAA